LLSSFLGLKVLVVNLREFDANYCKKESFWPKKSGF